MGRQESVAAGDPSSRSQWYLKIRAGLFSLSLWQARCRCAVWCLVVWQRRALHVSGMLIALNRPSDQPKRCPSDATHALVTT